MPLSRAFLLAEGWPFLALALLAQLLYRGDVFLLEILGVGRATVGHYSAAGTVVWGGLTLAQLSALALYPTLSRQAGDRSRQARDRPRPTRPALVAGAAGALGGAILAASLAVLARPLVGMAFGPGYEAVVELLRTLAWALPGASAAMLLGTVLAAWRRQRLALLLQGVAVLVALGADLLLIPRLGALGAARVAVGVETGLALAQLAILLGTGRGRSWYSDRDGREGSEPWEVDPCRGENSEPSSSPRP